MIEPIVLYGNEILRNISKPVTASNPELLGNVQNLWDTMYAAKGAGLAAPQIGIAERIFVIDLPDQEWKQVFVNPTIESREGENIIIEEGCLSLPGIAGPIARLEKIRIHYYDENWKSHIDNFDGIKARVIQHEFDHLDGILWIDHIKDAKFFGMLSSLLNIKNRNVEVSYPII